MSKSLEFERRLQCRIHADVSLAHVGGTADLVCVVCEHQEAVRLRAQLAGLERQADKYNERGECLTCGSSAPCAHDDLGTGFTALAYVDSLKTAVQERDEFRAEVERLKARFAAQQTVVDAAREIEAVDHGVCYPDLAHALAILDKAQAAQPEGERT